MESANAVRHSVLPFPIRRHASRRWAKRATPKSFEAALEAGWTIEKEKTVLGADSRHRHGTVILRRAGVSARLAVEYTVTVLQGFRFGAPQLTQ
jgi:hypothetical protein